MAKTVGEQLRGCFGCGGLIVLALIVFMFYHRYGWRERVAPKDARIAEQRMAEINRLYYRVHDEQGRFPESLEDLESAIGEARQAYTDPWGNPFRIMEKEGTVYVYSIGPDAADDGLEIKYDPTNGVESAGDLSMILRRAGSSSD